MSSNVEGRGAKRRGKKKTGDGREKQNKKQEREEKSTLLLRVPTLFLPLTWLLEQHVTPAQ